MTDKFDLNAEVFGRVSEEVLGPDFHLVLA
jgi:hypothetical protein